jgi:hypothetical protein
MITLLGRILGALLVLLGLAFNRWTLEAAVILDGSIDSVKAEAAIVMAQLLFIGAGAWFVIKAPRLRAPSARESVLLLVSTVFALGLAEVGLLVTRIAGTEGGPAYVGQYENRRSAHFQSDSQTGWRMQQNHEFHWTIADRRNSYRSNAQGFRSNRDFDSPPELLIALAGDSFTWGTGIDYRETFGDLLEKQLSGTTVFNFAMPGFGVDQMWMSARHQALPLRPVLLVVAFTDEDFDRSLTAYRRREGFNKPRFVLESGQLRRQTPADTPNRLVRMLRSKSRVWSMAANGFERLRPFGEWWALNTAILDAIAADSKQRGVPVLIVRLPGGRAIPRHFKSLADHMISRQTEFLDLGGPGAPPGIHFETDGHINPKGHQYVSGAISGWIRERLPRLAGSNGPG